VSDQPTASGVEWRPDPFGRFDERLFVKGLATDRVRRHIGRRIRVFEDAQPGTVDLDRVLSGGERWASGRSRIALGVIACGVGGFSIGALTGLWAVAVAGVVTIGIGVHRLRQAGADPLQLAEPTPIVRDAGADAMSPPQAPGFFFDPSQSSWSRRAESWRAAASRRSDGESESGPRSVRPPGLPSSEPPVARRRPLPPEGDIIDVDPE